MVVQLQKVLKASRPVPVIKAKEVTKVVRCPFQRRMPKRGFISPNRVEYKVFNLGQLDFLIEKYDITEFTPDVLYINGLISLLTL